MIKALASRIIASGVSCLGGWSAEKQTVFAKKNRKDKTAKAVTPGARILTGDSTGLNHVRWGCESRVH
ncbi:MAG TPA: hypothetical protein VG733_07630, partial [Chthoniobacteraceae bacterium]|nr:hypothetical protein [Chthoniobacteraceae bacterium]